MVPISTQVVLLLDEIAPVAFSYETCRAVLLSTPLLFCKSVRAVRTFVLPTTSEPGIVTNPSRSTETLESASVAFVVLSESLLRQM